MTISIIVAASINNCIGKQNKLPWHLSNDLQFFKKHTTNHCIIMGRNTFDSIGKALPNRVNIVISKNQDLAIDGVVVRNSLEDAIAYCKQWNQQEIFIIGGATVYQQSIDMVDKIYLTRVETTIENGDAFFEIKDANNWTLHKAERHEADEKNDFAHVFETYLKASSEPIIYR
jgi:dihydrofolate reductase